MAEVEQNGLHAPRVWNVAGECPVVYRHVRVQVVDDHLRGLLQRKALLVPAPLDVCQRAAVCRSGGVDGAQVAVLRPRSPETEQVHAVLLRDALCQIRDVGRGERAPVGNPLYPLPMGCAVEGVAGRYVEHGKRHDGIGHLPVAAQGLLQVLAKACLPGNLLKQPDVAIQLVGIVVIA